MMLKKSGPEIDRDVHHFKQSGMYPSHFVLQCKHHYLLNLYVFKFHPATFETRIHIVICQTPGLNPLSTTSEIPKSPLFILKLFMVSGMKLEIHTM